MPSVEQQIEQSRAKKKGLIKKALLGFTLVLFVGAAGVLLISYMPTVAPSGNDLTDQTTALPSPLKTRLYRHLVKKSEKHSKSH